MGQLGELGWKKIFKAYIDLHPEVVASLSSDDNPVVTDSDLVRDCGEMLDSVGELYDAGREIVKGAELASLEFQHHRGGPGRILYVRSGTGVTKIGSLRAAHVGKVISVSGLVRDVTEVHPRKTMVIYQCMRCGARHRVEQHGLHKPLEPLECYKENGGCNRAKGSTRFQMVLDKMLRSPKAGEIPDFYERGTEFTNEQWLDIQEPVDDATSERQPRSVKVRLLGDHLMDVAVPGDAVVVHGVLDLDDEENRELAPGVYIDCHHLENRTREAIEVTEEDEQRIREIAAQYRDPLRELLLPSFAPHIVGLEGEKEGTICLMFGGTSGPRETKELRGSIHGLMFGDPGTAKSLMLKRVNTLMPRATYVNAIMSSKAGLLASAEKNEGRWGAVPGPIVVSNNSVCCIDEVGNLKEEDLSALNECMEQSQVTLTKAARGVYPAHTSILAACNPKGGGRYTGGDFRAYLDITDATLSRFTFVYIIPDDIQVDVEIQRMLRTYYGDGTALEPTLLSSRDFTKYIMVARGIDVRVSEEAMDLIDSRHNALRKPPSTFTNRVLEDLYRISIAVARTRLSEVVTVDDAYRAIEIHAGGAWGDVHGVGDELRIQTIRVPKSQVERHQYVLKLVGEHEGSEGVPFSKLKLEAEKAKVSESELSKALERLHKDGNVIEMRANVWMVVR